MPRGLPAIRFVVDDSALTPFEYRRREISVFIPHGQEVREWNTSPGCVVYISVDTQAPVRILAIAGDLRPASSKSALVGAVERLTRDTRMEGSIYRDIDTLPPFDPDLDGHYAPATVASFRAALQACDAVLISSPESAHGVHGVMKNALDWVADSGDLVDKPIALINASGRARHAWGSLSETSAVMSAHVILEAWITVPLDGRDSGTKRHRRARRPFNRADVCDRSARPCSPGCPGFLECAQLQKESRARRRGTPSSRSSAISAFSLWRGRSCGYTASIRGLLRTAVPQH